MRDAGNVLQTAHSRNANKAKQAAQEGLVGRRLLSAVFITMYYVNNNVKGGGVYK